MRHMTALLLTAMVFTGAAMAEEPATQPAGQKPAQEKDAPKTVGQQFPRLASGGLLHAQTAKLPDGVILQCGDVRITQKELDAEIAKADSTVREDLRKNAFFLLEQMATQRLVLLEAQSAVHGAEQDTFKASEQQTVKMHFDSLVKDVAIVDDEMRAFYEANKDMVGGATYDRVKGQLRQYLLGRKKQEAIDKHIASLGTRMKIRVDSAWTTKHAKLAADNPVDKARNSGRPSLIEFGGPNCRYCHMMKPILKTLKQKYQDKLNVEVVDVQQERILAARHGIRGIPVQLFFDAKGKQVFRHTGFYPQAEIEKHLVAMGVE